MTRDGGKKPDPYNSVFALKYLQFDKETSQMHMKLKNA